MNMDITMYKKQRAFLVCRVSLFEKFSIKKYTTISAKEKVKNDLLLLFRPNSGKLKKKSQYTSLKYNHK